MSVNNFIPPPPASEQHDQKEPIISDTPTADTLQRADTNADPFTSTIFEQSALREKIEQNATLNSELLAKLGETEEAPGQLTNNNVLLDDAKRQLTEQEKVVADAAKQCKTSFKHHSRYRDSIIRMFIYRAVRKGQVFDAKAMQGEKAYFEAVEAQHKAEQRCDELKRTVADAEARSAALLAVAEQHGEAHARIDSLYDQLFSGPNPELQPEDDREEAFDSALAANEDAKERLRDAVATLKTVAQAGTHLRRARFQLIAAADELEYSLFSTAGGNYQLQQTEASAAQALALAPQIRFHASTPQTRAARSSLRTHLASVNFRNVYGRSALLERVAQVQRTLAYALDNLEALRNAARTAETDARTHLRRTARSLEDRRQALQQIRQEAFERVAGFGLVPPPYHECCDRTEQHVACELPQFEPDEEQVLQRPLIDFDDRPVSPPAGPPPGAEQRNEQNGRSVSPVSPIDDQRQ